MQSNLNDLIRGGIIEEDIVLKGEQIKNLSNVLEIQGSLGLSDSALESFGALRTIRGDLWISYHNIYSSITSLENIQVVFGDVNLRYSNVEDLGDLRVVKGRLSLRDTTIQTLGRLEYVGGDLFLPMRYKGSALIEDVEVGGKVRFWNDVTFIKPTKPENTNLIDPSIDIVHWPFQYINSAQDIRYAGKEVKEFYKHYKSQFLRGVFIDIDGNDNYAFTLLYDLKDEFEKTRTKDSFKTLQRNYRILGSNYPQTEGYANGIIRSIFIDFKMYREAWEIDSVGYVSLITLINYERLLGRSLLRAPYIFQFAKLDLLTVYGRVHKEAIELFIEEALKDKEQAVNCSYLEHCLGRQRYNEIFTKQEIKSKDEELLSSSLRQLVREAENMFRERKGVPRVGEGWVGETELYYLIKEAFPKLEVLQHGSPEWLGRQHLDVYLPSQNVGIEYQGDQHYKPIDFFGGEEAMLKTKERDRRKARLCKENGCELIIVNPDYDWEVVLQSINSAIN